MSARVSVVMPVFNGAAYLRACLDSVLAQTYRDFEVVVVDDGSSDDSVAILEQYAADDPRVRFVRHEVNRGHHHASNDAIDLAQGTYLARMDQDDLWLPRRLEASVAYLDAHPEVGLLSTSYFRLRPDGSRSVRQPPRTHTRIRVRQIFGNTICHPSVTLRRDLVGTGDLHYRDLPGPQDYDLWTRLLAHTRGASLAEPLVLYRENPTSMSELFRDDLPVAAREISDRQLRGLLGEHTDPRALHAVRRLVSTRGPTDRADYGYTGLVYDLFDGLGTWPDLDHAELRSVRRSWCRRALTTAARRRDARAARPLLRHIGRRDPSVVPSWLVRDASTRAVAAVRQRTAHTPQAAVAE